jgi:hemerythrin
MHKAKFPKLGIPNMDNDHALLFSILGSLDTAIDDQNKELAKKLLDDFFLQLDVHNANEEKFLEEIGYPQSEQHKYYHPEGSGSLIKYKKRTITNILWIDIYTLEYLLASHIASADVHYATWYNEWIKSQN